jgi:poly-gamma-glutamate synthesis protein (capsule biosynthesis protein)
MIYAAEEKSTRIVLGGDVMLGRRLSTYNEPDYLRLVDLFRGADASFINLEACVRHPDEGTPTIQPATFMTTPPALLDDLKWFGVSLASIGNNHVYDFGEGGVAAMVRHLRAANIPYAGAGLNMTLARRPCYYDGPKGRVGMVAVTTFFLPWSRAGEARPDSPGRPGLNTLRYTSTYQVRPDQLQVLDQLAGDLGFKGENARNRKHLFSDKDAPPETANEVLFLEQRFVAGDKAHIATTADETDVADNLRWIREARRQCDWLIVSVHSHTFAFSSAGAEKRTDLTDPADHILAFSRAAVDAGADIIAGHGSHTPLGMEFYKGKPILHGLGNMIFHNDTIDALPAESIERFGLPADTTPADFQDVRTAKDTKGHPGDRAFWENIVAECVFEGGALSRVVFHPIDLGHGRPRSQRGRPVMAAGEVATRVIERMTRLSAVFGVTLRRVGDTAVFEPRG